jgi:hypothetical protein
MMMRIAAGTGFALAACLLSAQAGAQTPPPVPGAPYSGSPADVERQRAAQEAFQERFRDQQKCMDGHRKEVQLHNQSRQIVQLRNNRAAMEKAMQSDPELRKRNPGGVEPVLTQAFAQYKLLGGPAATVDTVSELPNPCPPPSAEQVRNVPPGASAPLSSQRQLTR